MGTAAACQRNMPGTPDGSAGFGSRGRRSSSSALRGHDGAGDIVALTEDHCVVAADWCTAIVRAHEEHPQALGVSGAIENGSTGSVVDRATTSRRSVRLPCRSIRPAGAGSLLANLSSSGGLPMGRSAPAGWSSTWCRSSSGSASSWPTADSRPSCPVHGLVGPCSPTTTTAAPRLVSAYPAEPAPDAPAGIPVTARTLRARRTFATSSSPQFLCSSPCRAATLWRGCGILRARHKSGKAPIACHQASDGDLCRY